jgi:hypothetical protein
MAIKLWRCRCGETHGPEKEHWPCYTCRTKVINIGARPPVYHKKLTKREFDKLLKYKYGKKILKDIPFSFNCGMSSIIIIFVKHAINLYIV